MKTLTMTTKEVKAFLKENGFDLTVKKLNGSMGGYYMIGGRKNKDTNRYESIATPKLINFLSENFLPFDYYNEGKKGFTELSFNGGLSTEVQNNLN